MCSYFDNYTVVMYKNVFVLRKYTLKCLVVKKHDVSNLKIVQKKKNKMLGDRDWNKMLRQMAIKILFL